MVNVVRRIGPRLLVTHKQIKPDLATSHSPGIYLFDNSRGDSNVRETGKTLSDSDLSKNKDQLLKVVFYRVKSYPEFIT